MTTPVDPAVEDRLARLSDRKRELAQALLARREAAPQTAPPPPAPPPAPAPALAAPRPAAPPTRARRGAGRRGLGSSIFFFSAEGGIPAADTYRFVLDAARFADAHDFEAIWVPERHFNEFGAPYPNPAVLAAAVAAVTSRVAVRAGSVVLPLRDPVTVAEDWAMIHHLAPGRVGLAFASGWHPDDFVLDPAAFENRRDVSAQRLEQVRSLWSGGTVTRANGAGKDVELTTYPRLDQPLPVWLTSSSNEETWRRAARTGCNVLTGLLEQDLGAVEAFAAVYREERAAAGLDPDEGRITLMIHTFVGASTEEVRGIVEQPLTDYLLRHLGLFAKLSESQDIGLDVKAVTEADRRTLVRFGVDRYFKRHGLFGTPEECAERARAIHAAGVDEVAHLLDFGVPFDTVLAQLEYLDKFRALIAADADAHEGDDGHH